MDIISYFVYIFRARGFFEIYVLSSTIVTVALQL